MMLLNHGIEYMIYVKPGIPISKIHTAIENAMDEYKYDGITYDSSTRSINVVNQKRTDDRLLASNYYNSQKEKWFVPTYGNYIRSLKDKNVDMELAVEEKYILEGLMTSLRDDIDEYGWYEVYYFS